INDGKFYVVGINKLKEFSNDDLEECMKFLLNLRDNTIIFNLDNSELFIYSVVNLIEIFIKNKIKYLLAVYETYDNINKVNLEYRSKMKESFSEQFKIWNINFNKK